MLGVLVVVDGVTVGGAVGGRDGSLAKHRRRTVVALLQLVASNGVVASAPHLNRQPQPVEGVWAISGAFVVAVVVDIADAFWWARFNRMRSKTAANPKSAFASQLFELHNIKS